MSTNIRAVRWAPLGQGRAANVEGSGFMTMSDSWISLKPLIEDPSSFPTPRLNSSGPREVEGIVMCWSPPSSWRNARRTNRIPSASIRLRTPSMPLAFLGLMIHLPQNRRPSPLRRLPGVALRRIFLHIYKVCREEIEHLHNDHASSRTYARLGAPKSGLPRSTERPRNGIMRRGDGQAGTMTTSVKLDARHPGTLRHLNTDARNSYRDIAREVKASISTVSNRIRRLEAEGVITGYAPLIDESKLGFDVMAVVGVEIHKGELLDVQRRIAKDDRGTHEIGR